MEYDQNQQPKSAPNIWEGPKFESPKMTMTLPVLRKVYDQKQTLLINFQSKEFQTNVV